MQCEKDLREYIFFLIFFFNFNSNSYFVTPILASSLLFSRDADSHSGLKLRNILLKSTLIILAFVINVKKSVT